MPDDKTPRLPQWFALAVKPRFDLAVARTLELKGYETFLPLYRKRYRDRARSHDAELPLFPGYVCCRFDVHEPVPILTTPGVVQILGAGMTPAALDEAEVSSLQTAIRAQLPIEPFPFLQSGQRVRIEGGAFEGIEGIVMGIGEKLRLVLSITVLQKSVLLEIGRDLVDASGCSGIAEIAREGIDRGGQYGKSDS
jgi:transcription antitermination factor NusG